MSALVEAILGAATSPGGRVFSAAAGLFKISDIVSDFIFIATLSKYDDVFTEASEKDESEIPEQLEEIAGLTSKVDTFLHAAIAFTVIGLLFDLFKLAVFFREWCSMTKEEREERRRIFKEWKWWKLSKEDREERKKYTKEWRWWKHLNLIFEEIPQLLICIAFLIWILVNKYCSDYNPTGTEIAKNDECTEEETEYSTELLRSTLLSMLFTTITLVATLIRILWEMSKCCFKAGGCCKDDDIDPEMPDEKPSVHWATGAEDFDDGVLMSAQSVGFTSTNTNYTTSAGPPIMSTTPADNGNFSSNNTTRPVTAATTTTTRTYNLPADGASNGIQNATISSTQSPASVTRTVQTRLTEVGPNMTTTTTTYTIPAPASATHGGYALTEAQLGNKTTTTRTRTIPAARPRSPSTSTTTRTHRIPEGV